MVESVSVVVGGGGEVCMLMVSVGSSASAIAVRKVRVIRYLCLGHAILSWRRTSMLFWMVRVFVI